MTKDKIDKFIANINSHAYIPISDIGFAKKLIRERMTDKKFDDGTTIKICERCGQAF